MPIDTDTTQKEVQSMSRSQLLQNIAKEFDRAGKPWSAEKTREMARKWGYVEEADKALPPTLFEPLKMPV